MIHLIAGDARDVLPTLVADSVQCVVTSPPYYGLRDYGTAQWDGGDAACDHANGRQGATRRDVSPERLAERAALYGTGTGTGSDVPPQQYRDTCGKCGAVRIDRQIGLEATPDAYLATMVQVFREIRRVLRPDGTCWVNLGDSYASSTTNNGGYSAKSTLAGFSNPTTKGRIANDSATPQRIECNAKPKDLLLMPARLALALQADGWWVRSDIIWHKPNPMPESCTDRPTRSHEYVFLITKSARYYYDQQGIAEPLDRPEEADRQSPAKFGGALKHVEAFKQSRLHSGNEYRGTPSGTRNSRSVWTIATSPFSAAHFATFPPELAERCIRAGTSERGACSQCGKPWVRQIETTYRNDTTTDGRPAVGNNVKGGEREGQKTFASGVRTRRYDTTTGWSPGCTCHGHFEERDAPPDWISDETGERKKVRVWVPDTDAPPPKPCVVLDPFIGAGTTALVADRLQRDCIGIDLNTSYTTMAMERCRADAPLFTSFPPAEDPEESRMADLFAEAAE